MRMFTKAILTLAGEAVGGRLAAVALVLLVSLTLFAGCDLAGTETGTESRHHQPPERRSPLTLPRADITNRPSADPR